MSSRGILMIAAMCRTVPSSKLGLSSDKAGIAAVSIGLVKENPLERRLSWWPPDCGERDRRRDEIDRRRGASVSGIWIGGGRGRGPMSRGETRCTDSRDRDVGLGCDFLRVGALVDTARGCGVSRAIEHCRESTTVV